MQCLPDYRMETASPHKVLMNALSTKLMKDVSLISSKVLGSQSAQTQMWNEIHALIFDRGTPKVDW
jgi:hypothetical protein